MMESNSKDNIKEWLQLFAVAIAAGVVVFHINGFFAPKENNTKTEKNTQVADSKKFVQRDTVTMQIFRDSTQLKR